MSGKLISYILVSILLASTFVAFDIRTVKSQNGDWWNIAWSHRRQVRISERSGFALTDFPVETTFLHNGDVKDNGTDIRVICSFVEIPSYVEDCNSTHAKVVFEISLTALESKTLYIYYGNPNAAESNYPLVPLTISEGNTGYAIIDNALYIGWTSTVWGGSGPEVTVWTDYMLDFDRNGDPRDDADLITDHGGRKGGIGRFFVHFNQIGLGDYQRCVQTPIYVDIIFANASLRAYKNHTWVETTQADELFMFNPSWDCANYGLGSDQNIVDGQNINQITPSPPYHYPWNEMYISPVNPKWMAYRDSISGNVFGSTGLNIGTTYNYCFSAKEGSDWDRCIFHDFTQNPPIEPHDQPNDCMIYWYGDNSDSYTKTAETATILGNQPIANYVSDTITVPDDYPTIQEAINNANDGDTIFVRNGTYSGPITVNKPLTLEGENRYSTIIDGGVNEPSGSIVLVAADNVKVSGFTIQHCRSGGNALWLDSYINLTFSNNIITGCNEGVRILRSYGNIVSDNLVMDCYYNTGLAFDWAYNNTIRNNTVTRSHYGISGGYDCHDNTYLENNIIDNDVGFGTGVYNSLFFHNNFIGNDVHIIANGVNQFDQGYPSGGNYWSGYTGTDLYRGPYQNETGSDGIADAPYVVDVLNQDNYPFMMPSGWLTDVTTLKFSLEPNPAYVGQKVTMLGNLIDRIGNPIGNTKIDLYVNGTFSGTLTTNSSGWFKASGKVDTSGTYNVTATCTITDPYLSSHTEVLIVLSKLNTKVTFVLSPNPARIGEWILMTGNLTNINGSFITNAPLEVYVKTNSEPWKYLGKMSTDASGRIWAFGRVMSAGTYQIAVLYAGSYKYNSSYYAGALTIKP